MDFYPFLNGFLHVLFIGKRNILKWEHFAGKNARHTSDGKSCSEIHDKNYSKRQIAIISNSFFDMFDSILTVWAVLNERCPAAW